MNPYKIIDKANRHPKDIDESDLAILLDYIGELEVLNNDESSKNDDLRAELERVKAELQEAKYPTKYHDVQDLYEALDLESPAAPEEGE